MNEPPGQSVASFATVKLPLIHGPLVKIQIQPFGHEYTISKGLLCAESPVFTAIFEGNFLEAQDQTLKLEAIEDVISPRSFEALIQWLYLRSVKFDVDDNSPGEQISAAIELARLADMYNITGIEAQITQYIKRIIIANPDPDSTEDRIVCDNNTALIGREDIISGIILHRDHPVRRLLAQACVGAYLQIEDHKFAKLAQEYPCFGADLLHEVRLTLNGLKPYYKALFKDPITGKRRYLNQ
ncbi:uncharacterized protein PGRI_006640 [Penicillium griseofulvum]|uniref:BTB domain-containing protein n=1 Tax=Penicillium patulum TaxID=5078 RepID=A0A135LXC2_PENPA|nr:uncharacterized protein PGRI_006640 [Penicillium griseofulvum]KXG53614.1 hypothetical protein PGRI_006640 [Penicillium griseofulvum]